MQTTSHDIKVLLQHLHISKTTSPDGISNSMLKQSPSSISLYLYQLLNIYLETETLSFIWKQANGVHIFKSSGKTYPTSTNQFHY